MLMSSGDFHSQSSQRIRVGRQQGDRHLAIVGNVFSAAIWKSSSDFWSLGSPILHLRRQKTKYNTIPYFKKVPTEK